MSLWKQPRPRGFHHEFIYVDERKERLRKIEDRTKTELGQAQLSARQPRLPKGIFNSVARNTAHCRSKALLRHIVINLFLLVAILIVLMIVLVYLM